ncbi:MAG: zinc-ribbon and DUF3426 domain-containing protein [Pseudomonadota bacterium]
MTAEVECPQCGTVFAFDPQTLKSDDKRVRCGECGAVFDAELHRVGEQPEKFAETGVGWVVVASRDARSASGDDAVVPRYVSADDADVWEKLGAPADERASNMSDDTRNSETLALEAIPNPLKLVDSEPASPEEPESPAAAEAPAESEPTPATSEPTSASRNDDWQALLDEIDTLPDVDENVVATDDADPPEQAPVDAAPAADATVTASTEDPAIVVDDEPIIELTLDTNAPTDGAEEALLSTDVTESGEAVLDAVSDSADIDPIDADASDASTGDDAVVAGSGLPEPSDDEIMREFAVSESDFLPADDAFVEAVIDNYVLDEADVESTEADEAAAETAEPTSATASAATGDDDEEVDTSGIFVNETMLPEHDDGAGEVMEPAAAIETATSLDKDPDQIFETAIGLRPEERPPTIWSRYGGVAAALLALALVFQALHQYRAELATLGSLNPLYETVYGDSLAPAWDVRELCFEQRDASAADNAMRIVGRVRNRGSQPLPYPILHVTLLGRFDNGAGNTPLAHRLLEAERYMIDRAPGDRIAPGEHFDVQALLRDPGPEASGYELEVCFARTDGRLACNSGC